MISKGFVVDVVYAKTTTHVTSPQGHAVLVILGQHWPANDPIVEAYPSVFSADPVYGITFSVMPVAQPAELSKPPEPAKPIESTTASPGEKRETPKR
jgi:hypothetical protein